MKKTNTASPRTTWTAYYTRTTATKADKVRKADRKAKQKGWQ